MKIHVYSIQRNEAKVLPYWLRWYKTFAEKIFVFDDQSDDGSRDLLLKAGCFVRDYPGTLLDDGAMADLFSTCYREDRSADVVMCVDADEFIWAPNLESVLTLALEHCKVIEVMGYEMWAPAFPCGEHQIMEIPQFQWGEPALWWYNGGYKPCVFSPQVDMNFICGRHAKTNPTPALFTKTIKLLHYRNLGYQYYLWHHERNAKRLSPERKDKTWGQHNQRPLTSAEFDAALHRTNIERIIFEL